MTPRAAATLLLIAAGGLVTGCTRETPETVTQKTPTRLTQVPFGKTTDGQSVDLITLRTPAGRPPVEVRVITYGGIILSLQTPDRTGALGDIVLGFDALSDYLEEKKSPYFGCLIGRYCNRIALGRFAIDGQKYQLATNDGPNHLHGGVRGWDKVVWKAEPFQGADGVGVKLSHVSADGDEGYPGTVRATVTYTLSDAGELAVDYHATTDKATVINLTQHSYFNLGGASAADILSHQLTIPADRYTPINATLIPTGELAPVANTPFDFRNATAIGARINDAHPQIGHGLGYDHNWVLNRQGSGLERAAFVTEPTSGRSLTITTTEPGLQFYSGNFLPKDGSLKGKGGRAYAYRSGFCLETQHYPDSPNRPEFPTTLLRPGQDYRSKTVFAFGVVK
jgi:aldose 1-epimerase